MMITPLSFTIIDKKGNEFTEENKKTCECTWTVPKKNTLLTLPKEAEPSNIEEEYNTYKRMWLNGGFKIDYEIIINNKWLVRYIRKVIKIK